MKKNAAFIPPIALALAVSLTLSGCKTENSAPSSPYEAELVDEIPETKAAAETASVKASPSVTAASPALSKAFDGIDSYAELCFGYTSEGKYEPVDQEEYSSAIYAQYMASEEFYNMALEYDEYKDMSYEEFQKEMFSSFGIDPSAAEKYSKYSMFVTASYYSEDENADHSAAARKGFDFFAEKLSEDKTFSADKLGEYKTLSVKITNQGDVLSVSAGYADADGESKYIFKDETVPLYGEDCVLIGNRAVPADTESLYIFSEDRDFAEYYYDYEENSEEHQAGIFNYSSSDDKDLSIDLTDISEKLPNLKKLFISHHISVKGFEGLKKYSGFSELDISEWHVTVDNTDVLSGLSNVKKLRVRDVDSKDDIEWTANAQFSEFAFDCEHPRGELLKCVYSMPNVTELKLSYCTDLDLSGIEGMKGLKKLKIEIDTHYNEKVTDFAPLAKLNALEELDFTGDNGRNFESIGRIKTLKSLTLSELRSGWGDEKIDLSGLAACTSIEYLDVSSVDYSIFSAIPNMKKLKKIRFGEYSSPDGLEELAGLNSLEELIFEDYSTVDLKGVSKLKKLKKITVIKSDVENISEINECGSLKYLYIEGGSYDVFNAEDIENNTHLEELDLKIWNLMHYESFKTMTSLKRLNIVSRALDGKQTDDLKKAMPRCRIEVSPPEEERDGYDGDSAEEDYYISYAEPMEKVYIGGVRIESYYLGEDFWEKRLYIKSFGSEPVESLPEFLKENGYTEGISEIYISYPERDGIRESYVIEIIPIINNDFDYENREVFLSAFSDTDEDYVNSCRYRALVSGCEAEILLPAKGKTRE